MACAAPLATPVPAREQRKVVTVVFCDLVGSTAIAEAHDPEVLRPMLQRYFEEMRAAAERHGGVVEKFIGDAVVAVFGIPRTHEDDALRAVRSAAEMRDRLAAFGAGASIELTCRIGLSTGEVLIGGEDQPAVGDTMNTAARLQTAAEPGEILIGAATYDLVRDAVVAEAVEPLSLKGKRQAVACYRLLQVASLSPMRSRNLDAPMVGRERERTLLQQAFDRAVSDRTSQLFTVLGAAGAGKSRLVEDFLADLDGTEVMRGRCLPYGDGITYFPVAEAVKQTLGLADFDDGSAVRAAIDRAVAEDEHAEAITANLAMLLGAAAGGAREETFWAIRRFLEARARSRPVVVVFDDIHWAEPTFLDLIEHVADWSRDVPILLLCMSRLDLLDERPSWAGGKTNATTISLAPLTDDECGELIDHLLGSSGLPAAVRDRITGVAEGNPLFVEEMLRMLIDDGRLTRDGERWLPAEELDVVTVPPTISALLSARLDRLGPDERSVLERAAVAGKEFHRGALLELLSGLSRTDVETHLRSLVRKELVVPERSALPGEEAYRFRHLLIRDAAYDAIPKLERADVHEAFAGWLGRVAGDRIAEQEEILGYHLEQTHRLRTQLGQATEQALADRAAAHLASAGRRSFDRGDTTAAINLLSRAVDLGHGGSPDRIRNGLALARSLVWGGNELEGLEAAEQAVRDAEALGDVVLETQALVLVTELRAWRDPRGWLSWRPTAERAIAVLELARDDEGLAAAWRLLAWDGIIRNHYAESDQALARGLEHARAAGDRLLEMELAGMIANAVWGAMTVAEGIIRCERTEAVAAGNRALTATVMVHRSALYAMRGRFDDARDLYRRARVIVDELGRPMEGAFALQGGWYLEMIAGDFSAAEALARSEYERLLRSDARALLDVTRDLLALALCSMGRLDEADELAAQTEALDLPIEDVLGHYAWRRVRARVRSARGDHEEAVRLARSAAALFEGTDGVVDHAETLLDLAVVLAAAGEPSEAASAARRAVDLYERKQNVVELARARRILEGLPTA